MLSYFSPSVRHLLSLQRRIYTAFLFCVLCFAGSICFAQLNADFIPSKDKGCAPLYVSFRNTSTGNQDSCFWNLGVNGNTSDDCNPGAIFNSPGTYTIKLTIFKAGASSTVSKTITVFKDPVSNFNANPRIGCVPFDVQFQDLSTLGDAPITAWTWDFGDGNINTTRNPLHTYNNSGNSSVSLIVTDANGCKNTLTKTDFIIKANKPTVDFSVNNSHTCILPFAAQFTSTVVGTAPISYSWDFGNGATSTASNPTYNYNQYGNYNVLLTVKDANNCSSTKAIPNGVRLEKFDIQTDLPASTCTDKNISPTVFSNYSPFFCNWDFGNGRTSTNNTPTFNYDNPGTYTVNLTATNSDGCRDSSNFTVVVNEAPKAGFTMSQNASCIASNFTLTNTTTGAVQYKWIIKRNNTTVATSTVENPTFYLDDFGSYDVILEATSANGCKAIIDSSNAIYVGNDKLNPTVDIDHGCKTLRVHFNANLTHNFTPTSIVWDFGDGTTGTGENPYHNYTDTGTYYATITVTYDAPCPVLKKRIGPIRVGDKYPFTGDFDLTTVCVHKEMVTYHATGGIPTTEFTWLFGDGTDEGRDVTHIYTSPSQPKKYMVTLIADNNTCKDTLEIKEIFVAYPEARFSTTQVCGAQTVNITNESKGFDRATWDFGDGTIINTMDMSLTHTYPSSYTTASILLIVYNDSTGCVDSMRKNINFSVLDSINFSILNKKGCAPLFVVFNAPADSNIISYSWDLGYGLRVNGNPAIGLYPNPGQYIVHLTVRYRNGCSVQSSIVDTVTVIDMQPNFVLQKVSGCNPARFSFINISNTNEAPITRTTWYLDNGSPQTGDDASYTISGVGNHKVRMVVENEFGCKDSVTKTVKIEPIKADFTVNKNDVCAGTEITFNNLSTGNNLKFLWDFGDGTTSTDSTPTHVFADERNYDIKLKAYDGTGCEDNKTKNAFVRIKNLHVNFTASPTFKTCPDLISDFQLQAPPNTEYKNIIWDFGNGNQSNNNNTHPQSVYTRSDSFDVKLVVVDTNNCSDTILKKDYIIVSGPQGSFSFTPDSGCLPLQVQFDAQFKNTTTTIWDFGNGETREDHSHANNISYTYLREGEYTPTLILKDNFGCTVNLIPTRKINVARMYSVFEIDKANICSGSGQFNILDSVYSSSNSSITKNYWTVTDSMRTDTGVGTSFTPTHHGFYTFNKYVENTFGCKIHQTKTVTVFSTPNFVSSDDKVICKGEQIPLVVNTNATNIQWTPATGLNNTNSASVIAKPAESTAYVVKAFINPLCPVYDTIKVDVRTSLTARAYPDTFICIGDTIQLHAEAESTSINQTKIVWQASPTLSNNLVAEPFAFPKGKSTYYAIFKNGTCVIPTIPVSVDVKKLPTVKAGPEKIIIRGMEADLSATSPDNVSYFWSENYFLSCQDCANPMAKPEKDTSYKITVTNEFGCKATDNQNVRVIEDCNGDAVFLPNTFTPNGDGQNDILLVLGPGVQSVKEFRIFNRWGELVFETRDMSIGWDGTYKGEKLTPAVFVYYVDVQCIDGRRTMKKGNITLIR
ncbi:MAG: PKD domain-containing protein [Chitinophagales bacterium]